MRLVLLWLKRRWDRNVGVRIPAPTHFILAARDLQNMSVPFIRAVSLNLIEIPTDWISCPSVHSSLGTTPSSSLWDAEHGICIHLSCTFSSMLHVSIILCRLSLQIFSRHFSLQRTTTRLSRSRPNRSIRGPLPVSITMNNLHFSFSWSLNPLNPEEDSWHPTLTIAGLPCLGHQRWSCDTPPFRILADQ